MKFEQWWEKEGSVMHEGGCSSKVIASAAWNVALSNFAGSLITVFNEDQKEKDKEYAAKSSTSVLGKEQTPHIP